MGIPPGHVVLVASGGLDSTTLAHLFHSCGAQLTLLAVDYGQRHRVELEFAERTASRLMRTSNRSTARPADFWMVRH